MQLPSNCSSLFKVDSEDFLICTGKTYSSLFRPHQPQSISIFSSILDTMGGLSAKAQALKQIITMIKEFIQKLKRIEYWGLSKLGRGICFIGILYLCCLCRQIGNIKEIGPTCVLDFYVHQSCQRTGIGKEIFQKFLRSEGKVPEKLAYDRPSEKLLGFLKKHYGLVKFIPQNNNFVIYDKYFSKQQSTFTKNQLLYSKQTPIVLTPQQPKSSHQKIRPKTYLPSSSTSQQKLEPQQKHNAPTSSKLQKFQKIEQKQKLPLRPPSSKPQYTKLSNYPFEQQAVQVPQSRLSNRQFQQFHKKHKNISSQQFPLSNNTNQITASQSQKVVQKPKTPTNINSNTNKHANTNINTNTNNNTNNNINTNTNTNANSITNNNIYFRTTSNTYGNHYTYTNINNNNNNNINTNINNNNNGGSVGTFGRRR